ncbi:efflux RND transporter periplasmic adaptor subunit [Clostridium formicaceticum]|uniref:Periplasmic multidrug efflux lipoprotein n=1 Tax=Clostridium formicaceticum TaxID=1497 RepID=A0AAC9RJF3_9CLOT|nr:efflux RND transporter periplasmic adaptor subunit [Clostridium formicaceticum]AOY76334.1 hypothetical protein BJL90_10720 [Clostridium formicaceticum]ARE86724.1 periplasmic multidrug efflux lipoprotein precursor [Clostridium formicaceticum]
MGKRFFKMVIFLQILCIGLMGCSQLAKNQEERRVAVEVTTVKKSSIAEEITLGSKLLPINNVMIFPKTPGLEVTELAVNVGDTVKKGDFLFELDKTPVRQQIEIARRSYEQAQKNYRSVKQQVETSQQSMFPDIPVGMLKGYQNSAMMSSAMLENSLLTAEAQLEQARTVYATTLEGLQEMEYYAPIEGTVTQNNLQKNQMLLNAQPALVISDTRQLKIDLYVSQNLYHSFYTGKEVLLQIGDNEATGRVAIVNEVADLRSNLHYIQIIVDNLAEQLLAGSFCKISLQRQKKDSVSVIPKKAVFFEENEPKVYVITDQQAVKKEVQLGIDAGDLVEVISGVEEGDEIIVKGQHYIDENTLLIIVRGDEDEDS